MTCTFNQIYDSIGCDKHIIYLLIIVSCDRCMQLVIIITYAEWRQILTCWCQLPERQEAWKIWSEKNPSCAIPQVRTSQKDGTRVKNYSCFIGTRVYFQFDSIIGTCLGQKKIVIQLSLKIRLSKKQLNQHFACESFSLTCSKLSTPFSLFVCVYTEL